MVSQRDEANPRFGFAVRGTTAYVAQTAWIQNLTGGPSPRNRLISDDGGGGVEDDIKVNRGLNSARLKIWKKFVLETMVSDLIRPFQFHILYTMAAIHILHNFFLFTSYCLYTKCSQYVRILYNREGTKTFGSFKFSRPTLLTSFWHFAIHQKFLKQSDHVHLMHGLGSCTQLHTNKYTME